MHNHPFKQLLKNRNFLKLWLSQILSQITINLINFLILTVIFERTQSSVAVSLLWLAYSLPALFFAPISGSLVDNFSRRKIMLMANFLQAVVVGFYLIGQLKIFTLYTLVFLYSSFDQFYIPSLYSNVPALVDKDRLPSANGLFLLTQQGALIFGFGMGGIFVGLLGRTVTILLSSLLLLLAAISAYRLPHDHRQNEKLTLDLEKFWTELHQGLEFIISHHKVSFSILLLVFVQITLMIIVTNLPSYTNTVLNLDLNQASVALIIPAAIGAIIVTLYLPHIIDKIRKLKIVQVGFISAGTCLLILSFLSYFSYLKIPVAILVALILGMSLGAIMIPAQTIIQEFTPAHFRGRIYSALNFLVIIATLIPLMLSATLADFIGTGTMLGLIGVIFACGFILIRTKGEYVLENGFRF